MGTANMGVVPELPDRYRPDWAVLETATNENPFMSAGVELLKEATGLCVIVAAVIPEQPYDRDQAIRCGILMRITRLAVAMLRDTCVGDGEQQMSLSRQLGQIRADPPADPVPAHLPVGLRFRDHFAVPTG